MSKLFFKNSFLLLTTALLVVSGFFVFAQPANASISSIIITTPLSGVQWRGTQNITWSAIGANPGDVVDIVSTTDNFTNSLVAGQVSAIAGTFAWDTSTLPDSATYQIKIADHVTPLVNTVSAVFMVDNTRPTTTYIPSIPPDGLNGWYISVPTITLSCNDGSGSGCNKIW